jgi:hypothetical protein
MLLAGCGGTSVSSQLDGGTCDTAPDEDVCAVPSAFGGPICTTATFAGDTAVRCPQPDGTTWDRMSDGRMFHWRGVDAGGGLLCEIYADGTLFMPGAGDAGR